MSTFKLFSIIFIMIIMFGCQENIVVDPIPTSTETTIEKKYPNPNNGVFPYLQEFLHVKLVNYTVNGTDINVTIENRNIFNRGSHFFAVINYTYGSLMIYLNKPENVDFTIPYYGASEFTSLQLYCVMEY